MIGREILQGAIQNIESDDPLTVQPSFQFQGQSYRRNRRTNKSIDSRFGTIVYERWFFQNTLPETPGIAPLDVRLGLFAERMTPGLAEVVGRLAGDMPQQATLDMLQERFGLRPSVDTLRQVIADVASQVRVHHDEVAIDQMLQWAEQAYKSEGNQRVLLQVGRDGVFVPIRLNSKYEESSCGTLSIFDRQGQRLGTIYLGEMPEANQLTMTSRMTHVITEFLRRLSGEVPTLRYVTDAGSLQQTYFREVLKPMSHPVTNEPLTWTWGVDFFHACEYVTKIANTIFGTNTVEAKEWASEHRRILRDEVNGVSSVIRSAAQQRRRNGLKGDLEDYTKAINYLRNYRANMDYAERRAKNEPIGSGITEAGCKVIFNQRLKQSGMKWYRETGQYIVDLRTAIRSKIWMPIWNRIIDVVKPLPPLSQKHIN